ncbi:YafY family transcriptional regulator [Pedobacter sp. HDW13]|uniref:helix-turn-helix transcriptional regulator n=1 Tax=unclassified Pedobacter TaxID=2628915 RepID=UPI000F5A195C|nr:MULTISPECIES: YafY family protein [unclassified Pedobacter]QIL37845.1 YafY family transcriptional regulator [Pedobacter sp. HDW13]RQO79006.1 DNA-binding transcriptional regulator [Pedobacter sp. KBW01]
MTNNDIKRISRLTAITTQLQSKRLLTAKSLSEKFGVSIRTIYRDVKALEQAGIPVLTLDGKGYSLMEDYRLPPVMLTEGEANALITAEQLVLKNKDASFIREYEQAIIKIKSVLRNQTKNKANLLSERIHFRINQEKEQTSNYLSDLQLALTNLRLAQINYTDEYENNTFRTIEPFALYSTQENWLMIAFCRLRSEYRAFRLDRIKTLNILSETFDTHNITLEQYFEICRQKYSANP